jgi:hypothetical protein
MTSEECICEVYADRKQSELTIISLKDWLPNGPDQTIVQAPTNSSEKSGDLVNSPEWSYPPRKNHVNFGGYVEMLVSTAT